MQLNYRQGLIKCQVDANNVPMHLHKSTTSNYVDLYVNSSVVLVAFAHGTADYLYEETTPLINTWGPFTSSVSGKYWLYWDINVNTGERTFGFTTLQPVISNTKPRVPAKDMHWFDTAKSTMFVYGDLDWVEKIRCFAGVYTGGSTVEPYYVDETVTTVVNGVTTSSTSHNYFTSQVGLNVPVVAGFLLFDEGEKPVKSASTGKFLTTESHFYTTKSNVSSISFDMMDFFAQAVESIPAFRVVSYHQNNTIGLASSDDPDFKSASGIVRTSVFTGEVCSVISRGYITNTEWRFNALPTTPLYLGINGTIHTEPPLTGFIQKIGTVVSSDTILISIDPQLIYKTASHTSETSAVNIDALSGKFYTAGDEPELAPGTGPVPESSRNITACTYIKVANPKMYWQINHNMNSTNVFVQVYDDDDNLVKINAVNIVDSNTIIIGFSSAILGKAQLLFFKSTLFSDLSNTNVPVQEFIQPEDEPAVNWTVEHNLGHSPIAVVYDPNGYLVTPSSVIHTNSDSVDITFTSPTSGSVRFV